MEEKSVIVRQKFSPEKEKAAEMLAHGAKQIDVANYLSKHAQTVWGWCQDVDFKARIEEYKTNLEGQAREIIANGLVSAAKTVVAVASGEIEENSKEMATRIRAAFWILDFMKEKRLPSNASPKRSNIIEPIIDDEEAKDLLKV